MKLLHLKCCIGVPLLLVVGVRSGHAQQPYVADSSTALLYHLDETAGSTVALDASTNGRNATIGSGLTIGLPGQPYFGNAIQSSAGLTRRAYWTDTGKGTTSFLYPKANTSFTLECWVKMTNTNFTPAVVLMASQPTGSPQYDYLLTIASPSDSTRPRGLIFRDMGHFRVNTGSLTWDTNTWYHVAVVVEQGATTTNYSLYRTPAGTTTPTLVASATSAGQLTPSTVTSDRVISVSNFYADSGNDFFPGLVDEFRFSTVARTADDLKSTLGPSPQARSRTEVLAPNSETDHAMPLVAPWSAGHHGYIYLSDTGANGGQNDEGFSPAWQLSQIAAGHPSIVTFNMPDPLCAQNKMSAATWTKWLNYYQASIQAAAAQKLPIAFVSSQWESLFYADTADYTYFKNAFPDNPNVMIKSEVTQPDGTIKVTYTPQKKVSPFGPVAQWEDVGRRWATSQMMQLIQTWYPDPPAVFFISNNEAPKLRANELSTVQDANYVNYDPNKSIDYQKLAIGRGWIQRYRALQTSWKNNLTASAWKNNSKFIAYGAFGPSYFQRTNGWANASQYVNPADPDVSNPEWHIDPNHRMWDGGAVDNYLTSNYTSNTDYQVFSPQVESMNYEFMRREVMQQEPNFWLELVTWQGCDFWPPNAADGTCAGKLCGFDPPYTLPRYAGMVQFSMWILRPRVIRDNRGWATKRVDSQPYYDQLVAAADRVYASPTLQSFWRNSQLVANTAHSHPYRVQMAPEYQNTERMYLLSTNYDPTPWSTTQVPSLTTELKVYALARVKGAAGSRQWLVYAFAPKADAGTPVSTTITIPGYQNITVNATVGGSYYLVSENGGTIQAL